MTERQLRQRDIAQLALPGTVSRTGLELAPGLTEAQWLDVGDLLALVERANLWWIGDYLRYGEVNEYGDGYRQAMAKFELAYSTLTNLKSVAGQVEFYRRRENLSWSHHELVAPLEPTEQDQWLDRAEANNWSYRELQAWLKGRKRKPLPTHKPLLRFCQDLPTPIVVAQIFRVFFPSAETALDMTGGDGGFWDGSELLNVTCLIVDPTRSPTESEDFRSLPHIADDAYDVTLFDPPHLVTYESETSIMNGRFGGYASIDDLEKGIIDGSREAWRIGRLGTVIKVTDHVHAQHYVLESDWVREAIGQPPFDEVHQVRTGAMIDPKWEEQLSAYNNGSTYLVFRKDGPLHVRR